MASANEFVEMLAAWRAEGTWRGLVRTPFAAGTR